MLSVTARAVIMKIDQCKQILFEKLPPFLQSTKMSISMANAGAQISIQVYWSW